MFKRAGMLAPDGRCKTLDSSADGYVRGEACASAMLQLLTQGASSSGAVAYILGSAVNQDGRSSSLTAPNGPAQQSVLRQALRGSALQPFEVATLQLHGTGKQMSPGTLQTVLLSFLVADTFPNASLAALFAGPQSSYAAANARSKSCEVSPSLAAHQRKGLFWHRSHACKLDR